MVSLPDALNFILNQHTTQLFKNIIFILVYNIPNTQFKRKTMPSSLLNLVFLNC